MPDSIRLSAYGHTVVLTGTPEALAVAAALLPPSYKPTEAAAEVVWPIDDWAPTTAVSELELWVAEHAEGFIFVHAGCVAVDGRAIVLPGYSMSGKSTLTRALIRAGAEYLSDEYAVIDSHGQVHPYPRPLSIRSVANQAPHRIDARDLGARVADAPVRIGMVATLRYQIAVPDLDVVKISRAQAILDLVANTVPAQSRPHHSFAAAEAATAASANLRGLRGNADAAADELLSLLADATRDAAA